MTGKPLTGRVLGLDSGGTKTIAVVADQSGSVIARETCAGLDPLAGPEWEDRLTGLAGRIGPVDAAVLGLSCYDEIPEVSARQKDLALRLFGPECMLSNDVAIAFEGALGGGHGVLVLAGTGSMAWGRGTAGEVRVGGWGDAFGDEGSAFWIGRAALGMVSRHLDGRQRTAAFADALMQRLHLTADTLLSWTYGAGARRAGIAGVAREVSALADAGLPEALGLMQAAAAQLAEMGLAAARQCGAPAPLHWATAGSVMQDKTLSRALQQAMGGPPKPSRLPPVGGAVLLAARAAGWPVRADFIATLGRAISAHTPLRTESV